MTAFETSSRARASSSLSRSAASSSRIRSLVSVSTSAIVNSLAEEIGHDAAERQERPVGDGVLAGRNAPRREHVQGGNEARGERDQRGPESLRAECQSQEEAELR